MDWTIIVASVIGAVFGGGIGAVLTYRTNNRRQDILEFEVLLSKYKELSDRNEKSNKILEKRVQDLETKQITSLKTEGALRKEIAILKRRITVANKKNKDNAN